MRSRPLQSRPAEMVEEGDGWDVGDYAVKEDVNVVLEKQ